MPFIGRDWRSPGEAWVKTESLGWQRMKLIESQLSPICHQNPACSWPPKSDYGQHMATHCNTNGHESRDTTSSPGSSDSGRGNSVSPSPSGSPEKNGHHIFPLTISSPYGQFSYHSHHLEPNAKSNDGRSAAYTRCSKLDVKLGSSQRSVSECWKAPNNNSPENLVCQERHTGDMEELSIIDSSKPLKSNLARMLNLEPHSSENKSQVLQTTHEDSISQERSSSEISHQSRTCCHCHHSQGSNNLCNLSEISSRNVPYCPISVRTREVAMYNTISEAFYRLDFCNAVHDIRRFNYICKLLHLLITQSLTNLSGCATKVLFTILEQIAKEVSNNKRNIHVLKNLLSEIRETIQKYYCWGRPIGSSQLWQQHFDTIERISRMVDGIELAPPETENESLTFNELPIEMVREILLRLNDYRDLLNAARASPAMQSMINSRYIWERLCRYHFTEQQVKMVLDSYNESRSRRTTSNGTKFAKVESGEAKRVLRGVSSGKVKENRPTTYQEGSSEFKTHDLKDKARDDSASSYVTKTIKIFDNEGSSSTLGSSKFLDRKFDRDKRTEHKTSNRQLLKSGKISDKPPKSGRSSSEIDWEQVFHLLRKRFDLKEEYADCLLLCRHCRCLFWKSFGHPCIQDNTLALRSNSSSMGVNLPSNNQIRNSSDNLIGRDGRQVIPENQRQDGNPSRIDGGNIGGHDGRRLSVAILSRNFDCRAQVSHARPGSRNSPIQVNNESQRLHRDGHEGPLRELQADRSRGLNRARGRMNENGRPPDAQPSRPVSNRVNIIPEHVAISPQAFLKFFSL